MFLPYGNGWFVAVVLAAFFGLTTEAAFAQTASRTAASLPAPVSTAPTSRPVTLTAGPQHVLAVGEAVGPVSAWYGADGVIWLFISSTEHQLRCARRVGGTWSDFRPVSGPGWKYINKLTAIADAAGNPLVIWSGHDDEPGEAVAATSWSGHGWADERRIDRMQTGTSVTELISLSDTAGRIHVVYDRPLPERETYSIGFPAHGQYPDKCFHVVYEGGCWSKPQATTGPGRFFVRPLALSEGPAGNINLSAVAHRFTQDAFQGYFIVSQSWDGRRWSAVEDLAETDRDYEVGLLHDRWGNHIAWYPGDVKPRGPYGGREAGSRECFLERNGQRQDIRAASLVCPRGCAVDRAGHIAMLWQDAREIGHLRIWDGRQWSATLDDVAGDDLTASPRGDWLLFARRPDGIHLQEIEVRGGPPSGYRDADGR